MGQPYKKRSRLRCASLIGGVLNMSSCEPVRGAGRTSVCIVGVVVRYLV